MDLSGAGAASAGPAAVPECSLSSLQASEPQAGGATDGAAADENQPTDRK